MQGALHECVVAASGTNNISRSVYMNGCQNYGPSLGPIIIRHLIFRGPKRGL